MNQRRTCSSYRCMRTTESSRAILKGHNGSLWAIYKRRQTASTQILKEKVMWKRQIITLRFLKNSLPSSWSRRMAKTMWRMTVPSTWRSWSCGMVCTSTSSLLIQIHIQKWSRSLYFTYQVKWKTNRASVLLTLHFSVPLSEVGLASWSNWWFPLEPTSYSPVDKKNKNLTI